MARLGLSASGLAQGRGASKIPPHRSLVRWKGGEDSAASLPALSATAMAMDPNNNGAA